jgi:hypothetical protein
MAQKSATSSLELIMKENQYEEEAGLYFRATAIVFSVGISGKLSFAVSGATPGADQGL